VGAGVDVGAGVMEEIRTGLEASAGQVSEEVCWNVGWSWRER
jgi:hypothetical protein